MANLISIDVAECLKKLHNEVDANLQYTLDRMENERVEKAKLIMDNAALLPQLKEIAGTAVWVSDYDYGSRVQIDLGEKPTTKKGVKAFNEKLVALRDLLGNLKEQDKYLWDSRKKEVKVVLASEEHPGVKVAFITKLPKDGPCRIVRQKSPARTSSYLACSTQG